MEVNPRLVSDLSSFIRNVLKQELRACYPRDIVNQVCWAAKYDGKRPSLDSETAMRAVEVFFMPAT